MLHGPFDQIDLHKEVTFCFSQTPTSSKEKKLIFHSWIGRVGNSNERYDLHLPLNHKLSHTPWII